MKRVSKEFRNMGNLANISSTSRVLNLNLMSRALTAANPDHKGFFAHKGLSGTLILKSVVKQAEKEAFSISQYSATKLFKPFDREDLSQGGLFAYIGQPTLMNVLEEYFGFKKGDPTNEQDIAVLKALNGMPSLDPFMLREKMAEMGIEVDQGYFEIDETEWASIRERIISDFVPLAKMAFGENAKADAAQVLADKIWDLKQTQLLKPILNTLDIPEDKASEIIFSWKGLLYYKYLAQDAHADLQKMLTAIEAAKVYGYASIEQKSEVQRSIRAIRAAFVEDWTLCHRHLAEYEENYSVKFVQNQNPKALKQTLMNASKIFKVLGTVVGATRHSVSYWKYFSLSHEGARIAAEDFEALLDDFLKGTGLSKTLAGEPEVAETGMGE